MKVEINDLVASELNYIVELHQQYGAPVRVESIEKLINYVLMCIADGSRRPGSWEREIVEKMGLIAKCDKHNYYRAQYGKGDENEIW